jgi:phosphoglycolate phosphatase-like HAD superfamily hydrolase
VSGLLVLWDVDYTLVDAAGVGRELYREAFREVFMRELPDAANEADMAGRTDRAIAIDVLELAGVPDPRSQVPAFQAALHRLAPGVRPLVAATAAALPGAAEAQAALAGQQGVVQSLLTGNIRPLAEAKLGPLGLTGPLDLDVGAYGSEHEVRAELVHLSRERAARAYDADFGGQATVLIGDTPLDVRAALVTGARAIAVATGQFSQADLVASAAGAAAGAVVVLADLTDTAAVVAAVLDGRADSPAA